MNTSDLGLSRTALVLMFLEAYPRSMLQAIDGRSPHDMFEYINKDPALETGMVYAYIRVRYCVHRVRH